MFTRRTLLPLGALLVLCFIGSGALKNDHSGVLGVLSNASWLGFLALTLFFVVTAVVTIVNNRRRLSTNRVIDDPKSQR